MNPVHLYDLSIEQLSTLLTEWGEPAFRAKQIYQNLYKNLAETPDEMTNLSKALRARLTEETSGAGLELIKVFRGDGGLTRKAVWRLKPGVTVESVLMIYPTRATVCVSSQAGCPMGCTFCATSKLGFLHDLTPGMMVQQVLWAHREIDVARDDHDTASARRHRVTEETFPNHLTNVVYMGMGEPFNNYDNWWASVERLHDPKGFNLGARSFTVSTVGLVPGIRRLAKESLPINLAVSLHSADDERRSSMMPVNKRYPIAELLDSVRDYVRDTSRRVSFEYVLINGQNDTLEEANALGELLSSGERFPCHVNLIPFNPVHGTGMIRSNRDAVDAFQARVEEFGISTTVRFQRGADIDAACGQLAGDLAE